MLIRCAILYRVARAPKSWVNLEDHRLSHWHVPAIEGPEVNSIAQRTSDMKQPRDSGMRGLSHGPLHIEMKYRFGPGRSLFRNAPPARASLSRSAVSGRAEAHEIDIGMTSIRRPVPLEIVEESGPVWQEAVDFEIAQGKREGVIDADDCRDVAHGQ